MLLGVTDFDIVRYCLTFYGWQVAVSCSGVPMGVVGIGAPGACVCARMCCVVGGWIAHIEMLARRTCADSG